MHLSRLAIGLLLWSAILLPAQTHKTENVIFVMSDGLRTQEIFGGLDDGLLPSDEKIADRMKKNYWRDSPAGRRAALMPFLWGEIATHGQIYGNRELGSEARVTNTMFFSYPGYSEIFCGFADPGIDSNDKKLNPNITVFEWLNNKPAFHGKVAIFGAWDTFRYIVNAERSGIPVNDGWSPLTTIPTTPELALLNRLKADGPRVWDDEPFDFLPYYTAIEYIKAKKPRVLYLSLGETDDWAHAGNYSQYVEAAHRVDAYLKGLWETVQSMPQYRGKTTLIFSPDHGRGDGPVAWKSHGKKIPDSKYIWMAFLGPDTPPLGERSKIEAVTQSQIAATLAALLGEDYAGAVPNAGKVIPAVVGH